MSDPAPAAKPGRRSPAADLPAALLLGALMVVLSLVAFVVSFGPYYTYRERSASLLETACSHLSSLPPAYRSQVQASCSGFSSSAWHGLFGWAAVVLGLLAGLLAGGILLVALRERRPVPRLPLGAHVLTVVALVFMLAALLHDPDVSYQGVVVRSNSSTVITGHAWGFWLCLVALVGLAVCALAWTVTDRATATDEHGGPGGSSGFGTGRDAGRLSR